MSTSASSVSVHHPRALRAWVEGPRLWIELEDGRRLGVPLGWFAWLAAATDAQRARLRVIEGGSGLWWEDLDDGISVPALLGLPERG